jgi:glycosyltransferase involved in cell wall biosynthesis
VNARVMIVDGSSSFGGATTTLPGLIGCLRDAGLEVRIAASHADGWDRVGLAHIVDPLPSSFSAVAGSRFVARELQRTAALRGLLGRHQIDVVIANNDPAVNAAASLAARAAGLPVVQLIRGHARRTGLTTALLDGAAAIFSHGGVDEGRNLGFADAVVRRWQRLDEGLDPMAWPSPRVPGPPRWLWASTLARWKGLPLLVDALGALQAAGLNVPPTDVCFIRLASDHADADRLPTRWPVPVALHEHPRHLDAIRAGASVYIHTATVPEPFGRSVLEAMAAGLCPVVPDEGGAARLVEHGVTGLVYPARSARGLAERLAATIADPALVAACGQRAAAAARRHRTGEVLAPLVDRVRALGVASRRRRAQADLIGTAALAR